MRLETHSVAFLSTAHMDPVTAQMLDATPWEDWPVSGGPLPWGYMIYAHDEDCLETMPPDLWACFMFARANGCDYIRFDRDADEIEELPVYEW